MAPYFDRLANQIVLQALQRCSAIDVGRNDIRDDLKHVQLFRIVEGTQLQVFTELILTAIETARNQALSKHLTLNPHGTLADTIQLVASGLKGNVIPPEE